MKKGGFNILVDAFWGSSGKGKFAVALADKFSIDHASSSNMPNAGHTTVFGEKKFVTHCLPSACLAHRLGLRIQGWISPNSAFWLNTLQSEIRDCLDPIIHIHERAILMNDEFVEQEESTKSLLKIASTAQGAGAAQIARINRDKNIIVANKHFGDERIQIHSPWKFSQEVIECLKRGDTWLHEVSQGYALGLLHGTHYPNCTSRECSSAQAIVDMGISPTWSVSGDIYLNVRSWPIRVGNTKEGYSGDFFGNSPEVKLESILQKANVPEEFWNDIRCLETTTCTKRPRRFCDLNLIWLKIAAQRNGATKLGLNFIQYINWDDRGKIDKNNLSHKTRRWIDTIEDYIQLPVVWLGTGRRHEDQIWMQ